MNPRPDRVFVNARVWTGDRAAPHAESIAVARGTIVAIGTASEVANVSAKVEVVDLGGAWVTPGFHDAHMHLATGSLLMGQVDLSTAASADEAASLVARAARSVPEGEWIRAWGWDHTRWPGARWPERAVLDGAAPAHPVVATRIDGHAAWVNAPALARLGLLGSEPSGILLEESAERAVAAIPAPGAARRRGALLDALREVRAVGITSLEDVTEPWALPLYAALREEGALTARIRAWLPIDTDRDARRELRRQFPPDDPWVSAGTLKGFLDGTLGSRSAALRAPYADDPSCSGILRVDPALLIEKVRAADEEGWVVALHAIGDRALGVALDAFEALPQRARSRPHRIEHVQVAAPADLARFRRMGILASIQPVHFLDDRAWIAARLGMRPDALRYPWRSLLDAGIGVALGSDWPIATMDPRRGLLAAVVRKNAGDLSPGEALSPQQALRAYTSDSALARGEGSRAGILKAGFHADIVAWSSDPAAAGDASSGEACRVLATYVAGRRVWPDLEPGDAPCNG